jgi:hypothetical protein
MEEVRTKILELLSTIDGKTLTREQLVEIHRMLSVVTKMVEDNIDRRTPNQSKDCAGC